MSEILKFNDVSRVYTAGGHELRALDHIDLSLPAGKFIVVLGPSGAGKSTLLNLIGGLDSPTEGRITVDGRDISKLSNDRLAEYRAQTVGFVFQNYNLIPTLTVYENVALVREIVNNALPAEEMLEAVDLADHLKNFPAELSGGERQRISIARALLKNAPIVLLDEATASLDVENETKVQEALSRLLAGKTVLVIAHRMRTVQAADKIVVLAEGKVVEEGSPAALLQKENGVFRRMTQLQSASAAWQI